MIVYESIILMINLCVLILALFDKGDFEAPNLRVYLGDLIIMINMIFSLLAVTFMVIEILIKLVKTFKFSRNLQKKGFQYWLAIVKFLLRPEEMETKNVKILPLDLQQNNQETPNHRYSKSPLLPDLFHSPSPLSNSIILGSTFGDLVGTPRNQRPSLSERRSQLSSRLHIVTNSSTSLEGNSKKINYIVNQLKPSLMVENDNKTRSSFSVGENHLVKGEVRNKSLLAALERSKNFLLNQNRENNSMKIQKLADSRKRSSEINLLKPPSPQD